MSSSVDQQLELLAALVNARKEARGRPSVQELEQVQKRAALVAARAAARGHLQKAFSGDVDAARAAVEALPRELERALAQPPRARRRALQFTLAETAAAVKAAFESGRRGHLAARGSPWRYVQQEDLDDVVPDGWGESFHGELRRIGRSHELPPKSIALLVLLTWCFQFSSARAARDIRGRGAGAQFSIDWLARKLGCVPSWVKVCVNRLDPLASYRRELAAVRHLNTRRKREGRAPLKEPQRPQGTPYIERYRRLQRYAVTKQRDGGRAAAWVDKSGKPRFFCDVRGVCYVTDAGRSLLGAPRAPSPAPGIPSEPATVAGADLAKRARHVAWLVERRLEKSTSDPPSAGDG